MQHDFRIRPFCQSCRENIADTFERTTCKLLCTRCAAIMIAWRSPKGEPVYVSDTRDPAQIAKVQARLDAGEAAGAPMRVVNTPAEQQVPDFADRVLQAIRRRKRRQDALVGALVGIVFGIVAGIVALVLR